MKTQDRYISSRGQAIVETAIALPLMVLTLFASLYVIHQGVIGERIETSARYATLMSIGQQPFADYSLHATVVNQAQAPTLNPVCSVQPSNNVFSQSGEYNLSGSNHPVPLLQPLPGSVSSRCTVRMGVQPTSRTPYAGLQTIEVIASGSTSTSDNTLFGSNRQMTNRTQFSTDAVANYELTPTRSMHCFPDLIKYVGRSLKIHGIYRTGPYGYGNYVDDQAISMEMPNPQPLNAGGAVPPLAVNSTCQAGDSGISRGPSAFDTPIAVAGSAWFLQQNGFQLGYPGVPPPVPPGESVGRAPGANGPEGALDTLPGPNDVGPGDPGIPPLILSL